MPMSVDFHASNYSEETDFKAKGKVWNNYASLSVSNTWKVTVTMYLDLENLDLLIEKAQELRKELADNLATHY